MRVLALGQSTSRISKLDSCIRPLAPPAKALPAPTSPLPRRNPFTKRSELQRVRKKYQATAAASVTLPRAIARVTAVRATNDRHGVMGAPEATGKTPDLKLNHLIWPYGRKTVCWGQQLGVPLLSTCICVHP
ncbi:MAG: hypothetical protein Q9215_002960 [Flavoplaca cf. flavocitrina]